MFLRSLTSRYTFTLSTSHFASIHTLLFLIISNYYIQSDRQVSHKFWWRTVIRRYAWIVTTIKYALFSCNRSRGKKVAKELIGENYVGFVITDRFSSYDWVDPEKDKFVGRTLSEISKRFLKEAETQKLLATHYLSTVKNVCFVERVLGFFRSECKRYPKRKDQTFENGCGATSRKRNKMLSSKHTKNLC